MSLLQIVGITMVCFGVALVGYPKTTDTIRWIGVGIATIGVSVTISQLI
jgi:hypothetical protein